MSLGDKISGQFVKVDDLQSNIFSFNLANAGSVEMNKLIEYGNELSAEATDYKNLLEQKEDGL